MTRGCRGKEEQDLRPEVWRLNAIVCCNANNRSYCLFGWHSSLEASAAMNYPSVGKTKLQTKTET